MFPWVLLGIMLALGLLISVIYTAIVEFNEGNTVGGIIWIVAGLVAVGKYLDLNIYIQINTLTAEVNRQPTAVSLNGHRHTVINASLTRENGI